MTIEQAIYQIVHASYQERVQALEIIKQSLIQTDLQINEPAEPFTITPFKIGSGNLPTREQMYNERTEHLLGLNDE